MTRNPGRHCHDGAGRGTGTTVYCIALVAVVIAGRPATVAGQDLIASTRRMPASAVDSTLPRTRLDVWLASLRGTPASAITWEVNDCGEGGDGRDAPTCVEAGIPLGGDTVAFFRLAVRGLRDTPAPPAVFDLIIREGQRYRGVPNLREWIARVRRPR